MKCDPATIERLCSTPGAKVGGMGLGQPREDHVVGVNKMVGKTEENAPMKKLANKYRAVPTIYNGVRFASKSEAAYAKELDRLQAAGVVKFWVPQPVFRLGVPENKYVADAIVIPVHGDAYVVDVKGVRTAKFARDVRLWRAYGPCSLRIIKGGKIAEIIVPEQAGKVADQS